MMTVAKRICTGRSRANTACNSAEFGIESTTKQQMLLYKILPDRSDVTNPLEGAHHMIDAHPSQVLGWFHEGHEEKMSVRGRW
jgi:hypothetical protein